MPDEFSIKGFLLQDKAEVMVNHKRYSQLGEEVIRGLANRLVVTVMQTPTSTEHTRDSLFGV